MLAIISVILPAAIIVIAGYVAGKRVLDAAGVKALSDLVYFLFLPSAVPLHGDCQLWRVRCKAAGHLLRRIPSWFFAVALFLKLRKSAATPAAIVFALAAASPTPCSLAFQSSSWRSAMTASICRSSPCTRWYC